MRYLQYKTRTRDDTYIKRCLRHHILPLNLRRKISDIILLFKIANGHIDSPDLLSHVGLLVPRSSNPRRSLRLDIPSARTNYRQNSFFIRAANLFNSLSDSVDLFSTNRAHLVKLLVNEFINNPTT